MPTFEFRHHEMIRECILRHTTTSFDWSDWQMWRYCYEGGRPFRDEYLERFVGSTGQEGDDEFERRRDMTPIPAYAKAAINKIRNSIGRRLRDVIRTGGSRQYQEAILGNGRGVDLRGSSMNAYIVKKILPELLVIGRVGVLVEAPRIQPGPNGIVTAADVPDTFRPFLSRFPIEQTPIAIEAPDSLPSDFAHVLLETVVEDYNFLTGKKDCIKTFRYYWTEPDRDNLVNVAFLDADANLTEPVRELTIPVIPFVNFELETSLMADPASYQVALLNMMSADTAYAVDSNFPFLTKQRGATDVGDHLEGGEGDNTQRAGSSYGMYYGKNEERPQFISPPADPLRASLELRREMKQEIMDLVYATLADLSEEGTTESGLATIGQVLQWGEQRINDHWSMFEESREARRKIPTVSYPDSWSMKTDEERLVEAEKFIKLGNLMVGEKNKKQLAKRAAIIMHRGDVSSQELDAFLSEIDDSPLATADPDVVIKAKKEGILSVETSALALGAQPGEADKAKQDAADRASMVVAAQADATNGGRGNPDGMIDEDSQRMEKEADDSASLDEKGEAGRPEESE